MLADEGFAIAESIGEHDRFAILAENVRVGAARRVNRLDEESELQRVLHSGFPCLPLGETAENELYVDYPLERGPERALEPSGRRHREERLRHADGDARLVTRRRASFLAVASMVAPAASSIAVESHVPSPS
jgi:hypothetical protein